MKEVETVIFRIVTHKDHLPMAYFKLQNGLKFKYFFPENLHEYDLYTCIQDINYAVIKSLPNHKINLKLDEFCPIQKVNKDIYKKIVFNTTELN